MSKVKPEKIYLRWSHLKYVLFCKNSFFKQYSHHWKNGRIFQNSRHFKTIFTPYYPVLCVTSDRSPFPSFMHISLIICSFSTSSPSHSLFQHSKCLVEELQTDIINIKIPLTSS